MTVVEAGPEMEIAECKVQSRRMAGEYWAGEYEERRSTFVLVLERWRRGTTG